MKKILRLCVISVLMVALNLQLCFAGDALRKLSRGVANLATGWMEFPSQIMKETENSGSLAGLTVGPIKGLAKAFGRTLAGAYETATFIIPFPRGYEPVTEPEFIFN